MSVNNDAKTKTKTKVKEPDEPISTLLEGGASGAPSVMPGESPGLPAAIFSQSLSADADAPLAKPEEEEELDAQAAVFGDMLEAVGLAVADSQATLDQSFCQSIKDLADRRITVVREVVTQLDDEGMPIIGDAELRSIEVSPLQYFTPPVHQWEDVSVSMDLSVASVSKTDGVTFKQSQWNAGVSGTGRALFSPLSWVGGAKASYDRTGANAQVSSSSETAFTQGSVLMDGKLGVRTTRSQPEAAKFVIGPQISISPKPFNEEFEIIEGEGEEDAESKRLKRRKVPVEILLLKSDGSINPGKLLELECDFPFFVSDDDGTGDFKTDAKGKLKVDVYRDFEKGANTAFTNTTITARLNNASKVIGIFI